MMRLWLLLLHAAAVAGQGASGCKTDSSFSNPSQGGISFAALRFSGSTVVRRRENTSPRRPPPHPPPGPPGSPAAGTRRPPGPAAGRHWRRPTGAPAAPPPRRRTPTRGRRRLRRACTAAQEQSGRPGPRVRRRYKDDSVRRRRAPTPSSPPAPSIPLHSSPSHSSLLLAPPPLRRHRPPPRLPPPRSYGNVARVEPNLLAPYLFNNAPSYINCQHFFNVWHEKMSGPAIPQSVFDCGLGQLSTDGVFVPPKSDDEEMKFVSDLAELGSPAGNQDFKDCASKWANTREEFTGDDAPGAMVVTFCRPEVRPPPPPPAPPHLWSLPRLLPPPPLPAPRPPAPASSRPRLRPAPPPLDRRIARAG